MSVYCIITGFFVTNWASNYIVNAATTPTDEYPMRTATFYLEDLAEAHIDLLVGTDFVWNRRKTAEIRFTKPIRLGVSMWGP